MLVVQKYGGSSVANAERIFNVAKRISETYDNGNDVVVILSAQGDTTDDLIAKAAEINPDASRREMDMLLSTGEQQSVALMAMALDKMGYKAVSLNAFQVGIETTPDYSVAKIAKISDVRIKKELAEKNIVLVTGFQGFNEYGNVTTLGRGGSDTSAVAIAAALKADLCEIYTDVDGVYTCDPRIVKGAKKMTEISFDEMSELASLGAKVLHTRSVEVAQKFGVNLVVRSSLTRAEGTIVKEVKEMESVPVRGIASDKEIAKVTVKTIKDTADKTYKLFSVLEKASVSVDMISQYPTTDGTYVIEFTIGQDDTSVAIKALKDSGYENAEAKKGLAKVSIVGAGMATHPGVACSMFEALSAKGIDIDLISTSEISISALVDEGQVNEALNALHDKFELDK